MLVSKDGLMRVMVEGFSSGWVRGRLFIGGRVKLSSQYSIRK